MFSGNMRNKLQKDVSSILNEFYNDDKIFYHFQFPTYIFSKNVICDNFIILKNSNIIFLELKMCSNTQKKLMTSNIKREIQEKTNEFLLNKNNKHLYIIGFYNKENKKDMNFLLIDNIKSVEHRKKSFYSFQELLNKSIYKSSNLNEILNFILTL